jgi:hypothetical protein
MHGDYKTADEYNGEMMMGDYMEEGGEKHIPEINYKIKETFLYHVFR